MGRTIRTASDNVGACKASSVLKATLPFVLCALNGGAIAQVQIYRCTGPSGEVTLTNVACPSQSKAVAVQLKPNEVDMVEGRQEVRRTGAMQAQQAAVNELEIQPRNAGAFGTSANGFGSTAERRSQLDSSRRRHLFEQQLNHGNSRERAAAASALADIPQPAHANTAQLVDSRPIPSTGGGFYRPVAGGYMSPKNQFCAAVGGGMMCPSGFVAITP